uniref:inorganic diphosphatase n=1 Tax=viral metagenome TaxID=1070528 RepID=A0A6C0K4S4_9ZZZZ
MTRHISVYIEIAKFSNQKLEYDLGENKLVLDRVLSYPYTYPFAYGFIPNTLGEDGDELDVLVLEGGDHLLLPGSFCHCHIVGALLMEDEKGQDEKLLAIPYEKSLEGTVSLTDISSVDLQNIHWFFSNYKSDIREPSRWSRVSDFVGREAALDLYRAGVQRALDRLLSVGDQQV